MEPILAVRRLATGRLARRRNRAPAVVLVGDAFSDGHSRTTRWSPALRVMRRARVSTVPFRGGLAPR